MTRLRAAATVVAAALLVAGCAKETVGEAAPATTYAPDAVVLRVGYVGGFTSPSVLLTRLPLVSVYGDGRVITEGPKVAVYPAPALPSVEVRRVSAEGIDALVAQAVAAGVGTVTDYGTPNITDHPSTRFALLTATGVKTADVYALGETDVTGVTAAQRRARAKLRDLLAALTDLSRTLGSGVTGKPESYQPAVIAAAVQRWVATGTETDNQPEVAWPGPALPGAAVGPPELSCVLVTGDAVRAVVDAARGANGRTPWRYGDARWQVDLRPLLPDEHDCADLRKFGG